MTPANIFADVSDSVAIFKVLFFVAFIAVWMGVRARVKAKVQNVTDPQKEAELLLQSASKEIEEELARLRADLSAKEERVRSGSSPLQPGTVEERNRSLDDVLRTFQSAKNIGTVLDRVSKLQEVLSSYTRLSIDIKFDTLEELESSLKAAEVAQIQKGTKTTEATISDLRGHTTLARSALESAREATDTKVASGFVGRAEESLKAGFTVVSALRLIGTI
jgi:hypothetical protein